MLKITKANSKLKKLEEKINKTVYKFDLLAGKTCPFANECQSCVIDGKVVDGKNTKFRCFSASIEALYPSVYSLHKINTDKIRKAKTINKMVDEIQMSLTDKMEVIRIHSSGDFFNQLYFNAWLEVVRKNPTKTFYAYTKSLPFWIKQLDNIPDNMILTASYGGKKDHLIEEYNLRYAKVVFSKSEANILGLEIDKNDFSAYNPKTKNVSFALLIHGVQPKNTAASEALKVIKKQNMSLTHAS
jgi:hypothetical protein